VGNRRPSVKVIEEGVVSALDDARYLTDDAEVGACLDVFIEYTARLTTAVGRARLRQSIASSERALERDRKALAALSGDGTGAVAPP